MRRTAWIVAALLAANAGALAPARADDMRAQSQWNNGGYRNQDYTAGAEAASGINRLCGVGQIPHVFPNANGVRCESADQQ